MREKQSNQTRIVLMGLGVAAVLAVVLLWTTLARRSGDNGSAPSVSMAASDVHAETRDRELPASSDAQHDKRASATAALAATTAAVSAESAPEMVDVLVIDRANNKPVAKAELVYWPYTEEQERTVKFWEWLNSGEFDAHLQHDFETATADADGKARLKKPKRGAIVTAHAGELWGYGVLRYDTDSPWRLEIIRDVTLSALVVDASALPVGGARVALRMRSGDWFWDTVTVETRESDGIAILPHAGFILAQNNSGQSAASIALGGVLEKPVEVVLDPKRWPTEPVRLVVPSTGACEVLVVGPDGEASADDFEVSLRQLTPEEAAPGDSPRMDHSAFVVRAVRGRALFRHVTPGVQLVATAARSGTNSNHTARGPGPAAAGRTATITVRLGETVAIVRGRALDAQGSPLKKAKLQAWVEGEKLGESGSDFNWELESDDQGRFQVDLQPRTLEDGNCALVLVEPDEHGVELHSVSRPLPQNLPPGVHEMGDFALAATPVIASGRIVDASNAPVRNATVEVAIEHKNGDNGENSWWEQVWKLRAMSDAEGRFALHGRVKADSLALTASKEGAKAEALLVARGAVDVVLQMRATGEIAGRLLLDPSVAKAGVQLFTERTDVDRSHDFDSNSWAPAQLADDGSFVMRDLRAGVYTVKLRLAGSWDEIHSVEGVRVDSGTTTRDPRLDPLDLRTGLLAITLTIVDPDGQSVAHGTVQVTQPPKDGEARTSYANFENGKCTLTHDGHDVELLITSPGFRATRVEHVHDDRSVTLLRAPRIKLLLASGQRPPDKPFWLGVNLTSADDPAANFWSEDEVYFDTRGQLSTTSPAIGRMRVGFSITFKPSENSWTQSSFWSENETIIDVLDIGAEQMFEVTYDAKQLATTIEELRKQNH